MSSTGQAIPVKPSDIKEVLVEDKLAPLSQYLQTVYCSQPQLVPELWQPMCQPLLLTPM